MGWRRGSSGRVPALHVQTPELKSQFLLQKNHDKGSPSNRGKTMSDGNIDLHEDWRTLEMVTI
jgi:hypothetical protein